MRASRCASGGERCAWSAQVCHGCSCSCSAGCRGGSPRSSRRRGRPPRSTRPTYALCRCAHLLVLAALGRDEARARRSRRSRRTTSAPRTSTRPGSARVALPGRGAPTRSGDAEHAESLYERLAPYADRVAVSTPEVSLGAFAALPRPARGGVRAARARRRALRGGRRRSTSGSGARRSRAGARRPRRADRRPGARARAGDAYAELGMDASPRARAASRGGASWRAPSCAASVRRGPRSARGEEVEHASTSAAVVVWLSGHSRTA